MINFKAVLSEYWSSNFGLFFLVDETIYMYRCKFNLNFLEKLDVLITLKYKFGLAYWADNSRRDEQGIW